MKSFSCDVSGYGLSIRTLTDLFDEVSRVHPERPALADTAGNSLTYRQLRDRSARLARRIAASGARPGEVVGLIADRSHASIIGMLAILRAGCGYLPLDPTYPSDRLDFMVTDSATTVIVGPAGYEPPRGQLLVDRHEEPELAVVEEPAAHAPNDRPTISTDVAYIIYTSGSTGVPKGCALTHHNVLSMLAGALPHFSVGATDTWTVFHSLSFDFSVWELWACWASAGRALLIDADTASAPSALVRVLHGHDVTVLSQVPSIFRLVSRSIARLGLSPPLRYVVFGGEAVDLDIVGDARSRMAEQSGKPPRFVNMYGITEITVHATFKELTPEVLAGPSRSPIGDPLPHLRIEIRDPAGRAVPPGDEGEMWISGPSVARGYVNRADLTAARFVADPEDSSRVWYRSGDLARWMHGELDFVGRVDQQVKVRGFRIETGEIEAHIRAVEGVGETAVLARPTPTGAVLVATIVPDPDHGVPEPAGLRAQLARRLPSFMVPDVVLIVDDLPRTPSGKLDRRALLALTTGPDGVE
ncbi:amino acid adenylation domain-containing protein [Millisia brevis]|uniref:amino acid adenylation domain-containing protein n=1 Tax=Millisia brevis TaxID=264148 RepID=UPI00082E3CA6|nr:amino acid adenylation domain-containing protein [Millisia brevis]